MSGFLSKNWTKWFLQAYFEASFTPLKKFCRELKKRLYDRAKSALYTEVYQNIPKPSSLNFCRVVKDASSLALLWWQTTPFLFINSGRLPQLQDLFALVFDSIETGIDDLDRLEQLIMHDSLPIPTQIQSIILYFASIRAFATVCTDSSGNTIFFF